MKVTVERASLLKSLSHVHRVVERRTTIPILSNVLLRAENGALHLRATDLDLEVTEAKASVAELQAELDATAYLASLADQQWRVGQAEADALEARIEAERKKYHDGSEQERSVAARRASQAERRVAAAKAATVCLEAERKMETARRELTAAKQRSIYPPFRSMQSSVWKY